MTVAKTCVGWKVVLTTRVPTLAAAAVSPTFESLVSSIPSLQSTTTNPMTAADFDWALHPGGSTIITGVQSAMNLTEEHLRASYEIYMNYGNSSSATVMAVMNQLRNMGDGKENVIACAFGPGIALEMMMLRRRANEKPNDYATEDNHAVENCHVPSNGHAAENGHAAGKGSGLESTQEMGSSLPVPEVD